MRLLHFADLHLGVESYGYPDPATGLNTRLLDFLKALDGVVDFALGEGVDLVLFCGDAYKRGHSVDPTEQREFAHRIRRLANAGIPVVLVAGNHDLPRASGRASTVEIFPALEVPQVYVARRPEVFPIPTPSGPLQVAALPWLSRGALWGREETRAFTLERLDQEFRERMGGILHNLVERLEPGVPAVLAAHLMVMEAKVGSERHLLMGADPALPVSQLALPAFKYVALGHIHCAQALSLQPPVVYAGSLERLDFSDEGMEKGFYEVELNGGETRFAFHPLPARHFLTITLSVGEWQGVEAALLQAIERRRGEVRGAIVRVEISAPAGLEPLPGREVERRLREEFGAYYVLPLAWHWQGSPRTSRWQGEAVKLTPLQALERYFREVRREEADLPALLEYGRRLMEAEEAGDR